MIIGGGFLHNGRVGTGTIFAKPHKVRVTLALNMLYANPPDHPLIGSIFTIVDSRIRA
jgi:hypothetical protein